MKRKLTELLKSLLIVALAANAVFLAYKSGVFNEFLEEAGLPDRWAMYFGSGDQQGNQSSSESGSEESAIAAKPVIMAVSGDVGARCGAKNDDTQLNTMYERTVNIFGEALGSASLPEECSEEDWQAALGMPGIYWDYQVELPVASIVKWLGMSALNDSTDYASRFAVVIDENLAVNVYYADADGFSKCSSAAAAESLVSVAQEFLPNGAYFAFESEEVSEMVAPYTLLMPESAEKYVLEVRNVMDERDMRDHLAGLLEMNILGGASYAEKNGTMVYVGVNGILRVHTDGEVNYSVTDYAYSETEEEAAGTIKNTEELVEDAYGLISDIRMGYSGSEKLYVSDIKTDGERCEISFSYFVNGIEVVQRSGSAAVVAYENGRMVSLDMWLHSFHMTGEKETLLPELQAAAIAGGLERKGSLKLVYHDEGKGSMSPVWTVE